MWVERTLGCLKPRTRVTYVGCAVHCNSNCSTIYYCLQIVWIVISGLYFIFVFFVLANISGPKQECALSGVGGKNLFIKNFKIHVHNITIYTGLFKMIVGVLTTCYTQYTWDSSICVFLFNRTTLQVFVTYLTGALYVHPLWFYKHQNDNRVCSKLFVACNNLQFRDTCGKRRDINLILDVTP